MMVMLVVVRPVALMIVMVVVLVVVIVFFFRFEDGFEAAEAKTFIETELHQLRLKVGQMSQGIDLAQHPFDTAPGGFAGHRERVSEQRIFAKFVIGLVAIEEGRDLAGLL